MPGTASSLHAGKIEGLGLRPQRSEFSTRLQPIQTAARAGLIVDEIRRSILCGQIVPGSPLVERDLAEALGVSKTPVREAIKALVATGLVEVSPYRGASVRKVDRSLATNVYAVRVLLEPEAVRLAAQRRPDGDLEHASLTLGRADDAAHRRDYSLMALLNREFHHTLTKASGNTTLVEVLSGLQDQTALVATQGWRRQATWADEAREHSDILSAVRAGNGERASQLMREHINGALAVIIAHLDNDLGEVEHGP